MQDEFIITDFTINKLKDVARTVINPEDMDDYTLGYVRGQKAMAEQILLENDIEWK